MRISTTPVAVLSMSVSLLAISLSGCGGVSDAGTYRANGQGRGLGRGCNSHQQTVNNTESVPTERAFQGRGGRGQGRGYRMVSLESTGCGQPDSGTSGCKSNNASCGQSESCGHGTSTHGCAQPSCSGCSKVDATCSTFGPGWGNTGKCGESRATAGCEGCPESCGATKSEHVSPEKVPPEASFGFGRGGGWGRHRWNEDSAPPVPQGHREQAGCNDGKCPSADDQQEEGAAT